MSSSETQVVEKSAQNYEKNSQKSDLSNDSVGKPSKSCDFCSCPKLEYLSDKVTSSIEGAFYK